MERCQKKICFRLWSLGETSAAKKSLEKNTGTKGWDSNNNWVAETDGDMKMFSSELFFFRCVEKEKKKLWRYFVKNRRWKRQF